MATIFAANDSTVMVDGKAVDGVRSIEYRQQQARESVFAIGRAERLGVTSGARTVEGRMRIVSTSGTLDGLAGGGPFQITALFKQGETKMTVTFDECFVTEKSLSMNAGGTAESVYGFTATRVREEVA
jgi:hypothetical protein